MPMNSLTDQGARIGVPQLPIHESEAEVLRYFEGKRMKRERKELLLFSFAIYLLQSGLF